MTNLKLLAHFKIQHYRFKIVWKIETMNMIIVFCIVRYMNSLKRKEKIGTFGLQRPVLCLPQTLKLSISEQSFMLVKYTNSVQD